MSKIALILSILIISTLLWGGCGEKTTTVDTSTPATTVDTSTPAKTLKIGVLADLTGPLSVIFIDATNETQIIADFINEKGGITVNGEKYEIELVIRDSKSSMDGAAAGASKLVYDDKVKFVVGPMAFESLGANTVFVPNNIFNVLPYVENQPGELDASTPYNFAGDIGAIGSGMTCINALQTFSPDAKTVIIVLPDVGSIPYLEPTYVEVLTNKGYTVLNNGKVLGFPDNLDDFTAVASKINLLKPDAIIQPSGMFNSVAGIIKGLRALGNNVPYYVGATGTTGPKPLLDIIGPELSNNIFASGISKTDPDNPQLMKEYFASTRTDLSKEFFGHLANCLYVLTQMIEKANSFDPDVIKATWESTETIESILGTLIWSGDKTFGIPHHVPSHPISWYSLDKGVISYLGWVETDPIP